MSDAIALLMRSRLLEFTPEVIARASAACGVSVGDVKDAWRRLDYGYAAKASGRATAPGRRLASSEPRRQAAVQRNLAKAEHRCCRCGEPKALREFPVRDKRTMAPAAMCYPCRETYQQERYVRAVDIGFVNRARARLAAGDPWVGEPCSACGESLEAGDEVTPADAVLRHCRCPQGQR